MLFRLHVGLCAGEYRPAMVQRAYDDGSADLVVFSSKADEVDTGDNSFDRPRVKVFADLCENGQACAIENTDRVPAVVTKRKERPAPKPVVELPPAPEALDDDEVDPDADDLND